MHIVACPCDKFPNLNTSMKVGGVCIAIFEEDEYERVKKIEENWYCNTIQIPKHALQDVLKAFEIMEKLLPADRKYEYDILRICEEAVVDYVENVYDDGNISITYYNAGYIDGFYIDIQRQNICLELTTLP